MFIFIEQCTTRELDVSKSEVGGGGGVLSYIYSELNTDPIIKYMTVHATYRDGNLNL